MRAIAVLVMFAAACSYSDPDTRDTRFQCSGDGPCPAGQKCAGTICVAASADGVACATETCAPGEQCCDDGINPLRCLAGSESCLDTAFCDGTEDCLPGQRCCALGVGQECSSDCAFAACQQPQDCPSSTPNCCDDPSRPRPWKFCQIDPC